jgi:hypothetical protein
VGGADVYRELGESAWSWVRASVRDDEGPWLPTTVDGTMHLATSQADRATIYFGTGGLALVLAEVQLARPLHDDELRLAEAIRTNVAMSSATRRAACLYWGLAGDATVLRVLGADADGAAVLRRIAALRVETRWDDAVPVDPEIPPFDVLAGMAGVALAGVWWGGVEGLALARRAADGLIEAAEHVSTGLDWPFFPGLEMRLPNFSHGTAGIVAALALAGDALDDPTLVDAARRGAEHLVAIGDLGGDGFTVPHYVPHEGHDEDDVTFSWCHGPTGTSLTFAALREAGVDEVCGLRTEELQSRCLRSVLDSGVPDRLRPGFWDNDGQCCGTAGVGDVLLDAAQGAADPRGSEAAAYVEGARRMGDALVSRVVRDAAGSRWQFSEHRAKAPLLAPGTGWSQGAAGIASFLLRLARILEDGLGAPVIDRPDTWWSVPSNVRTVHRAVV